MAACRRAASSAPSVASREFSASRRRAVTSATVVTGRSRRRTSGVSLRNVTRWAICSAPSLSGTGLAVWKVTGSICTDSMRESSVKNSLPTRLNGSATRRMVRLRSAAHTASLYWNSGDDRLPLTWMFSLMTPLRSLSNDTSVSSGRPVRLRNSPPWPPRWSALAGRRGAEVLADQRDLGELLGVRRIRRAIDEADEAVLHPELVDDHADARGCGRGRRARRRRLRGRRDRGPARDGHGALGLEERDELERAVGVPLDEQPRLLQRQLPDPHARREDVAEAGEVDLVRPHQPALGIPEPQLVNAGVALDDQRDGVTEGAVDLRAPGELAGDPRVEGQVGPAGGEVHLVELGVQRELGRLDAERPAGLQRAAARHRRAERERRRPAGGPREIAQVESRAGQLEA